MKKLLTEISFSIARAFSSREKKVESICLTKKYITFFEKFFFEKMEFFHFFFENQLHRQLVDRSLIFGTSIESILKVSDRSAYVFSKVMGKWNFNEMNSILVPVWKYFLFLFLTLFLTLKYTIKMGCQPGVGHSNMIRFHFHSNNGNFPIYRKKKSGSPKIWKLLFYVCIATKN